jgi:hypothetical protein
VAQEQQHAGLALELEQREQGTERDVDQAAAQTGIGDRRRRRDPVDADHELLVEEWLRDVVTNTGTKRLEPTEIPVFAGEHERYVGQRRVLRHRDREVDAAHVRHRRRGHDRIGTPDRARLEGLHHARDGTHLEPRVLEATRETRA